MYHHTLFNFKTCSYDSFVADKHDATYIIYDMLSMESNLNVYTLYSRYIVTKYNTILIMKGKRLKLCAGLKTPCTYIWGTICELFREMIPKDIESAVYLFQYMHVCGKNVISIQIHCLVEILKKGIYASVDIRKSHFSFNSLWPSNHIYYCRHWPTLVLVIACCHLASSHYLNQWWVIIN